MTLKITRRRTRNKEQRIIKKTHNQSIRIFLPPLKFADDEAGQDFDFYCFCSTGWFLQLRIYTSLNQFYRIAHCMNWNNELHTIRLDWVQHSSVYILFWRTHIESCCVLFALPKYKSDSFTQMFFLIFRSQYLHTRTHAHSHIRTEIYTLHTCFSTHSTRYSIHKSMHSLVRLPWIVQIEYELTKCNVSHLAI